MLSPSLIRQHVRFPAFSLLKQFEEVGNGRVCIGQGEGDRVAIAPRGHRDRDDLVLDLHERRAVSKQDAHQKSPSKTQRNQCELGFKSYTYAFDVLLSFSRQPRTDNHPQARGNPQPHCYRQRNGNRSYADQVSLRPIPLSTHIRGETSRGEVS